MALNTQASERQEGAANRSKFVAISLGVLLLLTGLLINQWSIEWILVGELNMIAARYGIFPVAAAIIQAFFILPALWLLIRKPALPVPVILYRVAAVGLLAVVVIGGFGSLGAVINVTEASSRSNTSPQVMEEVRKIIASEEHILLLTLLLRQLEASVMNLEIPEGNSLGLFEEQISYTDLDASSELPEYTDVLTTVDSGVRDWRVSSQSVVAARQDAQIWKPLFDQVEYFERAFFKIKKGKFLNESKTEFESSIKFDGQARLKSGKLATVISKQTVSWRYHPELGSKTDEEAWLIYDWQVLSLETMETPNLPLAEVLDAAIVDPQVLDRARDSIHERLVTEFILDPETFQKPHSTFSVTSVDRHPGVSVVDLDQDGFDDLYVMARWGENMFFLNQGDGTFKEMAAELGLNVKDHTSSAIFADFDNDGDFDAFLGRTLQRSMYLVNEGGKFVDRSDTMIDGPRPFSASSVTAVDYNNDGLLDIYVSTYTAKRLEELIRGRPDKGLRKYWARFRGESLTDFMTQEEADLLNERFSDENLVWVSDGPGPPNVLLKNLGGGRFEVDADSPGLRVLRNTYQSTWADFDNDGDPDVYLANDFAPNNMLRNDGDGKFVDITEETGTADVGFGMGAAWGDYDNDSQQDLYVTNMYSTAGHRITSQLSGIDPTFSKMAEGNSLFNNEGTKFCKVSGVEAPDLTVESGGWGWGSQFVDFDNDGYLDIYALSGFFTAPKEVALPVDV